MNPFQASKQVRWLQFADVIAILALGMAMGIGLTQVFSNYEVTETTKVIRRAPATKVPAEDSGKVQAPQQSIRIEEI